MLPPLEALDTAVMEKRDEVWPLNVLGLHKLRPESHARHASCRGIWNEW